MDTQYKQPAADSAALPIPGGVREILMISLPMVVSFACETVMTFTDRLFLSRVGPEQMSAAMAGGLSSFTAMTFVMGLTGYTTALAAQHYGAGQKHRCPVALTQAILICIVAYPLILLGRPLVLMLFDRSGVDPAQLEPQKLYFSILLYATIVGLIRNALSSYFSGIGRTRVVMTSAMAAMITNIGCNYVLIFGKLGFPVLGIRGAAYGTIIGGIVAMLILTVSYFGGANRREFGVMQSLRYDREMMRKLLRYGLPAGIEMFLNLLAFTTMIVLFHKYGLATAAAVTIVFNWDMVSFVPLLGIQIGVTSLVGRYMGAGDPDTAHRSVMSGLKSGWVYSSVILILFVCLPEQLVAVFKPAAADPVFDQAAPIALFMIRFAAVYVMVDTVMVVFSGALRGAGDTLWAMMISVTLHWMLVPVLAMMQWGLKVSPEVSWVAVVSVFMLFSAVIYARYRTGKWRLIKVVETELSIPPIPPEHFHESVDL